MNLQILLGLGCLGHLTFCLKQKSTRSMGRDFDGSSAGVNEKGSVSGKNFKVKESVDDKSIKLKRSSPGIVVTGEESKVREAAEALIGATGEETFEMQTQDAEEMREISPRKATAVPEDIKIDKAFDPESTLMRVLDEKKSDDFAARLVQANRKRIARSEEKQPKQSIGKALSEKTKTGGILSWLLANKTIIVWIAAIAIVFHSQATHQAKKSKIEATDDVDSDNDPRNLTALSQRIAVALSDKMVADHSSISGTGFLVEFDEFGDRKQTDLVELQGMVRRAAAALHSHGCHNQKVLLCTPPGVHFYVTILSCLRHGVVVIPVPPTALKNFQEIRRLVAKHEIELVVVTKAVKDEWKQQEGSQNVVSARNGRPLNFIEAQDLVSFPHELIKSSIDSVPLQPTDCACILTEDTKDNMVNKVWTSESLDQMSETWIEAGINRRASVGSLAQHTGGTSIGLFLSTLSVGGKFIVSANDCHPSKRMVEYMGMTHCFVPDRLQFCFDWGSSRGMLAKITGAAKITSAADGGAGAAAYLSKVFTGIPLHSFVEGAKESRVAVESIYSSAMHFGGAHGKTKAITLQKDALWQEGNAIIAPKKTPADRQEVVYSCGKVRSGVVVRPIERGEGGSCLSEEPQVKFEGDEVIDVVGEIWIQPSLCVGEERYGMSLSMDHENNLINTGDFGFVSSSNDHLYIMSKQDDFIPVQGSVQSCVRLEDQLRTNLDAFHNVSIFRLKHEGKNRAVVVCEIPNSKDCELMAFKIRDAMLEDDVPLQGIGLVPKGEIPMLGSCDALWRAQLKIKWYNQKLNVHSINGWWEMKDDKLVNLDQLSLNMRLAKAEDSDSDTEDLMHGVYS